MSTASRISPPSSGPQASGAVRRRRHAARRRRLITAAVIGAVLIAAILAARPLFEKAISELTLPLHYSSVIRREAAVERLDPALIAAVIYAETRFDARTSPTGAKGLMQIEPATAEFLARRSGATDFTVSDLAHPAVNIAYGSYYLRYLLDEFHGSELLALAAYNGGETNAATWLADSGHGRRGFRRSDIPFPATRAYVAKVMDAQHDYRRTYARQLGYG